ALLAEEVDPALPAGDEGPEPAPGLEQVGPDILDRDRRLPEAGRAGEPFADLLAHGHLTAGPRSSLPFFSPHFTDRVQRPVGRGGATVAHRDHRLSRWLIRVLSRLSAS